MAITRRRDDGRALGFSTTAKRENAAPMSATDYWRQQHGFGMPTMASTDERSAWRGNSPTAEMTTSDQIRAGWGWQGPAPMASPSVNENFANVTSMVQSGEAQRRNNGGAQRGAPQPASGIGGDLGKGFGLGGDNAVGFGFGGNIPAEPAIGTSGSVSFPSSLPPASYYSPDAQAARIAAAKTGSRWTQGVEQANSKTAVGGGRFTNEAPRDGQLASTWQGSPSSKTGEVAPLDLKFTRDANGNYLDGDQMFADTKHGQVFVDRRFEGEKRPAFDKELAKTFGYMDGAGKNKDGSRIRGVGFPSGEAEAKYNKAFADKNKTGWAAEYEKDGKTIKRMVPIRTANKKDQVRQTNATNAADQAANDFADMQESNFHFRNLQYLERRYPKIARGKVGDAFRGLITQLARGGNS